MSRRDTLEQLLRDRMTAMELSRGQLGRRLSANNPSKALRRMDAFASSAIRPPGDLQARLASALDVSSAALEGAAQATQNAIAAKDEADYRSHFKPHAIWTTTRSRPSSVAMAGFINAPSRLVLPLPADLPIEAFIHYCQSKAPKRIVLFGSVIGFTINYTPDHAIRYDLNGQVLETLPMAQRVAVAFGQLK